MKIAIMQPYFFPYPGYFQLIAAVDHFIFLDDVNYIKGGWINRNRILLGDTPHFISIPLQAASPHKKICDIAIAYTPAIWLRKLLLTLQTAYQHTPYFGTVYPRIEALLTAEIPDISTLAKRSVEYVLKYLDIPAHLTLGSAGYNNNHLAGQRRVIDIVKQAKGTCYINSPGGRGLYNSEDFSRQGITLKFLAPSLPEYDQGIRGQLQGQFIPALSIIDLLMRLPPDEIRTLLLNPPLES